MGKIIYYLFFKIYTKYSEIIYCYLNLRSLFSSLITFFVFCIFYYFDICIIPNNFLDLIKNLLGLLFFFKCTVIIYNLFYGLYLKFVYDDDVRLVHTISSILLFVNFLINLTLLYSVFGIENIDYILQYNILYVIDFIMLSIIKLYNYHVMITDSKIASIQNFISYPIFFLLGLFFIIKYVKGDFKYYYCSYFIKYIYISDFILNKVHEVYKRKIQNI